MILLPFPLVLASGSPRRKELLSILNQPFEVLVSDVDESFDPALSPIEVPGLLSDRKAGAVQSLRPDALILAADTVVELKGNILNKPLDKAEAREMLEGLSGTHHEVHSAYTLLFPGGKVSRTDTARVYFKKMDPSEITYYLENGKPFDKAGSYGIQEWIGLIGVEKLEGSYFTVMGLPTHLLWKDLMTLSSS